MFKKKNNSIDDIEIIDVVEKMKKSLVLDIISKLFSILVFALFIAAAFNYKIVGRYIAYNIIYKYEVLDQPQVGYVKEEEYTYFNSTHDFYPKSEEEIIDIFYTAINNGWTNFAFVCEYDYKNCEQDVSDVAANNELLTSINNFVHPFNSFDRLKISMNNFGKITIEVIPLYTKEQITIINTWVDDIIKTKINSSMTIRTKILTIHDLIINKTVYDKERAEAIKQSVKLDNNYSHIAYGIIINGKAVCGGYTDLMTIFLERFGVENYKISTADHVWNLVKYNDQWLHLDLTWDDPVSLYYPGRQSLSYNYFLITTTQLHKLDSQHNFDTDMFKEAQ